MKRIIISFVIAVGFLSITLSQTDNRSRETRIADIVMLLPADNTATFNKLMNELLELGDVINDLAPRLTDSGDTKLRYAISGLAMYASKDVQWKPIVAKSLCDAIPNVYSDEIRDFLLIQLQYVAGDESLETAALYLDNPRLADAAARVLVRIGNDNAGKTLTDALAKEQQITLIKALGEMRYKAANSHIKALSETTDANIRKTAFFSLAQIADPASEKILSDAAKKAGYKYEPTDALGSYILFMQNSLNEQAKMVTKSAKKMLNATSETSPSIKYVMITPGVLVPVSEPQYSYKQINAKCAALELLTLASNEKAVKDIIEALKSGDKQYRQAALHYSENIKSKKMFDALIKHVQKEKRAEVKAEIITAFGVRGDKKESWSFILNCLNDKNPIVRSAAIVTAGKFDGAPIDVCDYNATPLIVKAMNTSDELIIATGKSVLLTLVGEQVVAEVAAAIPQTSSQAKIAFLEILSERRAVSYSKVIFEQTSSTDANLRLVAINALPAVVSEKDIQQIAQLLNSTSDKDERTALQRALFVAVSEKNQNEQTDIVATLAEKSDNMVVYGNVMAMIGGEKALNLLMEYGFNSGNAEMKDAAFEALLNWSDGLAIPKLYSIAADEHSGVYFDRALNACIAKTGVSENKPEQKLLMLRNTLDIAKSTEQKQTILQHIGRTGTFLGLMVAGKYLDNGDNAVQQAAVQAVRTIALSHPEYYGTEIKALLNKAMAVNKDPEADYQKQAILKHLSELPKDGGFEKTSNDCNFYDWTLELCNEMNFDDFELYVDWRNSEKTGNDWNSLYIKKIGKKETIYRNGLLTTDSIAFGDKAIFRDFYIREIPRPKPYQLSEKEKSEGFTPMFNGIDMTGWTGNLKAYIPQDGTIVCDPSQGGNGNLYTEKEYSNFIMRFEFLLTPAANNGIGIRAPLSGDAAYGGMEIQVLDNEAEVYSNLKPYQYHGSVYGVIPAKRGYLKPVGEWNIQEIIADGNHIKVTLNGKVILDGDIAEASKNFTQTMDGLKHTGLSNKSGHIGFLGHGSWVAFRNLRIKEIYSK